MNRTLEIVKTIYEISQLEPMELSQVALAGRSNVGKSSLVNCLGGRKKLAKISSTPGKTRSLNYFLVHPDEFYLVDLPGYGYAKCSKAERAKWGQLIERYMTNNPWLKAVAVLLDSRLSPQKLDIEMTSYLKHMGIPVIPVLTKGDKIKQRERAAIQRQWRDLLQYDYMPLVVSSKTGMNRDKLWEILAQSANG
ncbi:ribosome biogenesis GTP-binding protein YihA/YsxC [Pseudodesulfovibrio senegalensis]|uniref:Probable GTP-binding protein EngB n=1 Tax=Pseudodesulfovibrio senegalensis TaxID=1721087 RepID=A0A6N6MZC8_9BACT|nr:ribosome biogenesis GTP-binding protein YihA/YsxC [Pseudodesulfovibrio senegalensis]KAB1441071.1 YihA family ribosome biogenesis GTP-binding protein [Pseudodesulfovibrio senegalensis]